MNNEINDDVLKDLGFTLGINPWSGLKTWMHFDNGKYNAQNFIISYDIDTHQAKSILGEFSIFARICKTFKDLDKFVESTYFIKQN